MEQIALSRARDLIAEVGEIMLQRNLTDLAGGNISMRVEDKIIMSPSYAGQRKFWRLKPEDVLVLDLEGKLLSGKGKVSREAPVHTKLLNSFYTQCQAVIHAHPRNIMVFCAARQVIPPVLENSYKFGEIQLAEYARGGVQSSQLAENVYKALCGQEKRMSGQAAAVLVPWHGLFAAGKDLYAVMDAIERIEVNARCILMGKVLLSDEDMLYRSRHDLAKHMEGMGGEGE
ncbi:MAG: class II aldolase/adducin family protein [Dehalococcoidia bacterium]|nr:class II aldolase/adducin family protein [Dehalococcoidia bacterium]